MCVTSSSLFVLASLCVCVCESIMETRHAGNANKKKVPHKMLAQSDSGGGIGQRDSQAKAKAAGYAYQI